MSTVSRKGAEEARNQLPALLEAAEQGRSTIIARHGPPVAALVPLKAYRTVSSWQTLFRQPAPCDQRCRPRDA